MRRGEPGASVRGVLFVMIGRDGPDGAERRNQHRAAHVAYLETLHRAGRIAFAGPMRNPSNDCSVGAVIVLHAATIDEARRLVDEDPFVAGGVYSSWSLDPFRQAYPKGDG